jgi:hypothetical protein
VEILTLEVDLVSLDTGATVDRFSCRLDQVDLHLPFFQLHGSIFIFIAVFKLKNEALGRSKKDQIGLYGKRWEKDILLQKRF